MQASAQCSIYIKILSFEAYRYRHATTPSGRSWRRLTLPAASAQPDPPEAAGSALIGALANPLLGRLA